MRSEERPRRLALSRSRRLSIDVVHYNRRIPMCAHDRRFDLNELSKIRSQLSNRISWSLLFIKAYALVARKHRVLRQSYIEWPWAYVLEHPYSVAMLATEREFRGERWLFWSTFQRPEERTFSDLQHFLNHYQTSSVETTFQQQWRLSGLPTFLRRCLWWWTLNFAGGKRAKRVGTFLLTTLASKGVEIQDPPAFLTTNLTYGPLDESGHCRVTLSYDHRLMDGSTVADVLVDLEATLNGEIRAELQKMLLTNDQTAA